MSSDTAPAAAPGLPSTDYAAALLPKTDLERLSNANLFKVAAILQAASDMMAYSSVNRLLEGISGMLVSAACDVRAVVESREPTDGTDARWRGWLIASHAVFVSESLSDITIHAAQAAAIEHGLPSANH